MSGVQEVTGRDGGMDERGNPAFDQATVVARYSEGDMVARVDAALAQAGFGDGPIPWDVLSQLDQFHVGGAAATVALAEKLGIAAGSRVLDVGCGLGGPSRHLAATFGCAVEGIDLSRPLIELATTLTRRTGLSNRVHHQAADACHLPFQPESFNLAWTQHVAMNIADRRALYAGVHEVLRPGGRFAIYDVVAGDGQSLHFPVPWAREREGSFLLTLDATRAVLEASGFVILDWVDATEAGQRWFQGQAAAVQGRPDHLKLLALPLIMGPEFSTMTANLGLNFREGRARLLQAIVERPQ